MDSLKSNFVSDAAAQLKNLDEKDCALKLFEQYKVIDFYLKGLAYHSLGLISVKNFENEAFESTRDTLAAAVAICSADEKYGKAFDEAVNPRKSGDVSLFDDSSQRCIEKYYLDRGILNASDFNVFVSSINATNCEEIYKNLDDSAKLGISVDDRLTMYGLSSLKAQECSNQQFIEQKVLLRLTSFEVAIRLSKSQETLRKLRQDYIYWSTANLRFVFTCLAKLN